MNATPRHPIRRLVQWGTLVAVILFTSITAYRFRPRLPIDSEGVEGIPWRENLRYSWFLREMGEDPLAQLASNESECVYRYTLIPTWGNPYSVRAEASGNEFVVTHVRLKGDGGYEVGEAVKCEEIRIPRERFAEFERLIEEMDFFRLSATGSSWGFDGEEWILECVRDGEYHVANRWSPEEDDPTTAAFAEACTWLGSLVPGADDYYPIER